MRYVRAFGRFWRDFLIGDTPELAVGAVLVLMLAFVLGGVNGLAVVLVPTAVIALLVWSTLRGRAS
ncbi:MAG TPA: hypothetical protein VEM41_10350 [Actinomycetota bacterium]|nr:hypothetical protein [Actinomycetota bacterium]